MHHAPHCSESPALVKHLFLPARAALRRAGNANPARAGENYCRFSA